MAGKKSGGGTKQSGSKDRGTLSVSDCYLMWDKNLLSFDASIVDLYIFVMRFYVLYIEFELWEMLSSKIRSTCRLNVKSLCGREKTSNKYVQQ